ncbi:MAG: hypothetical protein U9N01_02465 [Euryarchaeota archaeon]|nr:hypothetical protein [Euryarchaeota archaeon]
MKKKTIVGSIAIAAIVAVAIFTGCIEEDVQTSTKLPKIPGLTEFFNSNPNVTEQTLPYVKASGLRVCLVNYKNATDPTWDELISFLESDDTDEQPYIEDLFVCADFAEMLHNNAEESGIKALYVGVDFIVGEGHALNAFNTTDKGFVYVDCTRGFSTPITAELPDSEKREEREHDKIAYVVEGKEYGLISIDKATSSEYWFYEDYKQEWEEYDRELEAYNNDVEVYNNDVKAYKRDGEAYERAVGGRTYISDHEEYERLNKRYNELKARKNKLDIRGNELDARRERLDERQEDLGNYRWESLGVVANFEGYW